MARSRTIQTASLAVWASCKRALYLEDPSLICPLLFIRSQEVLSRNCTHRELRDHGVKSASNCRASGSLEPSAGLNSGCLCHAAVANGAAGDAFFGDEDSNSTRKKRVEGAPNDLVPNLPRDSITWNEAPASLVLLLLCCSVLTCRERHTHLYSPVMESSYVRQVDTWVHYDHQITISERKQGRRNHEMTLAPCVI
jgi:hypothetical protein